MLSVTGEIALMISITADLIGSPVERMLSKVKST